MDFNQIDEITSSKTKEKAKKARDNAKEKQVSMAQAYARVFSSDDGQKVLQDLSALFIYGNNTDLRAPNINYESAYHNGESGVVKFIIDRVQKARVI